MSTANNPLPILNKVVRKGLDQNNLRAKTQANISAFRTPEPPPSIYRQQRKDDDMDTEDRAQKVKPQRPAADNLADAIARGTLTATEIDFVVERIVQKHTNAMKRELKTVLTMLASNPKDAG